MRPHRSTLARLATHDTLHTAKQHGISRERCYVLDNALFAAPELDTFALLVVLAVVCSVELLVLAMLELDVDGAQRLRMEASGARRVLLDAQPRFAPQRLHRTVQLARDLNGLR